MRFLIFSLIITIICSLSTLARASEEISDRDRFMLWNGCRSMNLVVESLSDDAKKIDLSEERIETTVRSRLRAARLYTKELVDNYLYVQVSVVGSSSHISISYNKQVMDYYSQNKGYPTTWSSGSTGTHGRDGSSIISAVSEIIDRFIDEILRVNATACKNPK